MVQSLRVFFGALLFLVFLSGIPFAPYAQGFFLFSKKHHSRHSSDVKDDGKAQEPSCESAKEFITTMEYLKSKPNLFPGNDKAISLALTVSEACQGSAARFVQAVEMLQKANLTTFDILERAKKMAAMAPMQLETYVIVFKMAFASDGFDYDLHNSLELAERLSVQYKGPIEDVKEEFVKLSQWCLDGKKLPLPAPSCGEIIKNLILSMEKHKIPVSEAFDNSFSYLTAKEGGQLIAGEALKWSIELVSHHPDAIDDFKSSFEYAKSTKGLSLSRENALSLARKIALARPRIVTN